MLHRHAHRSLISVFLVQALISIAIASIFIYAIFLAYSKSLPPDSTLPVGKTIQIAFECTLFGMWLLFGILFFVLKFRVIEPISSITESIRNITSNKSWSSRLKSKPGISELDHLVDDFNQLVEAVEQDRRQLHESSIRDHLTGLLNRRGFEDAIKSELERTRRNHSPFAIIHVDLDDFKSVNDTFGHPAGDFLLRSLSHRLRRVLRTVDSFARVGGDEFLILLPGADTFAGLLVAEKLHKALEDHPFPLGDGKNSSVTVTASFGVASCPKDGIDSTSLLQSVDNVLYRAKRDGKNCVVPLLENDHSTSLTRPSNIQAAIDEGRITAAFQPIVSIDDGRIVAYEALARICSNGEVLTASMFIDSVLDQRHAKKIDEQVLSLSMEYLLSCEDQSCNVFINFSSATFSDSKFMYALPDLIKSFGAPCTRVVIEITERDALPRMEILLPIIASLRSSGIRFALDDFGTGFSSFAYARHLDVDYLKIDGSFVQNLAQNANDRTIVETLHGFAQSFGLTTIAEFVENDGTVQALVEIGVNVAQGYHFGRPELFIKKLAAKSAS